MPLMPDEKQLNQAVIDAILVVLASGGDRPPASVTATSVLADLEIDSLALAEVLVLVEDELETILEIRASNIIVTVGDFCQALVVMSDGPHTD